MSTVTNLYKYIQYRIGDPNGDEVDTGAGSTMLKWINQVQNDVALLTDCFQTSGTVTGDGSAEDFVVNSLTGLIRILSVTDKTDGIVYRPVSRSEYQGYRNNIINNSLPGVYVYNLFGYSDAGRKISLLPVVANSRAITIEYSKVEGELATGDTPDGLLANYDEIFIEGVASIYFDSIDNVDQAKYAFEKYMMWVKKLSMEVGINPVIKPEMSSLWRGDYVNSS